MVLKMSSIATEPHIALLEQENGWSGGREGTCMEQNLGPHMEQKWAVLAGSWGSVASWNRRAVTGSSDRWNWSYLYPQPHIIPPSRPHMHPQDPRCQLACYIIKHLAGRQQCQDFLTGRVCLMPSHKLENLID